VDTTTLSHTTVVRGETRVIVIVTRVVV